MLQCWNVLTRQFDDYEEFSVSESDACEVTLPEVNQEFDPNVRVSRIWRVLILHPRDKDDEWQVNTAPFE